MAKTKALISFAVTAKLICVFVFTDAKSRFSHDTAHICPVRALPDEQANLGLHCLLRPNLGKLRYKVIVCNLRSNKNFDYSLVCRHWLGIFFGDEILVCSVIIEQPFNKVQVISGIVSPYC